VRIICRLMRLNHRLCECTLAAINNLSALDKKMLKIIKHCYTTTKGSTKEAFSECITKKFNKLVRDEYGTATTKPIIKLLIYHIPRRSNDIQYGESNGVYRLMITYSLRIVKYKVSQITLECKWKHNVSIGDITEKLLDEYNLYQFTAPCKLYRWICMYGRHILLLYINRAILEAQDNDEVLLHRHYKHHSV
jgi:hypothetical protein